MGCGSSQPHVQENDSRHEARTETTGIWDADFAPKKLLVKEEAATVRKLPTTAARVTGDINLTTPIPSQIVEQRLPSASNNIRNSFNPQQTFPAAKNLGAAAPPALGGSQVHDELVRKSIPAMMLDNNSHLFSNPAVAPPRNEPNQHGPSAAFHPNSQRQRQHQSPPRTTQMAAPAGVQISPVPGGSSSSHSRRAYQTTGLTQSPQSTAGGKSHRPQHTMDSNFSYGSQHNTPNMSANHHHHHPTMTNTSGHNRPKQPYPDTSVAIPHGMVAAPFLGGDHHQRGPAPPPRPGYFVAHHSDEVSRHQNKGNFDDYYIRGRDVRQRYNRTIVLIVSWTYPSLCKSHTCTQFLSKTYHIIYHIRT